MSFPGDVEDDGSPRAALDVASQGVRAFRTSVEFLPILTRQRDHATEHGQTERAELFDNLIGQIDDPTS